MQSAEKYKTMALKRENLKVRTAIAASGKNISATTLKDCLSSFVTLSSLNSNGLISVSDLIILL